MLASCFLWKRRKNVLPPENLMLSVKPSIKGKVKYHDEVYGDIEIDYDELDEGVLLKSDGFPTYNFANVVERPPDEHHACCPRQRIYFFHTQI
ncbi:MAG: glutamate--tRNA ligase family protein [Alphaproteobacteria bacterium]